MYVLCTVQDMRVAFINGKAALLRNVRCYVRQWTEQICASGLHCFLLYTQIRAVKPPHTMWHAVELSPPSGCTLLTHSMVQNPS